MLQTFGLSSGWWGGRCGEGLKSFGMSVLQECHKLKPICIIIIIFFNPLC